MTKTFRQALLDYLASGGMQLPEIAKRSGVSHEQLKKVRQREGASTNVEDALAVANACGFSLDEFLGDQTRELRATVVDQYTRLTDAEKDLLLTLSRGRAVQHPGA